MTRLAQFLSIRLGESRMASLMIGIMLFTAMGAALGLLIAVVSTGVGMIGPVLSYELLERHDAARGALLGGQAAAGNLGQSLGSVSAGLLFAWQPVAPFWAAAGVLLLGGGFALASWGPARDGEIAADLRNRSDDDG